MNYHDEIREAENRYFNEIGYPLGVFQSEKIRIYEKEIERLETILKEHDIEY